MPRFRLRLVDGTEKTVTISSPQSFGRIAITNATFAGFINDNLTASYR